MTFWLLKSRQTQHRRRIVWPMICVGLLMTACSSDTDRSGNSSLFGSPAATQANASAIPVATTISYCPNIDIRSGAGTLSVNAASRDPSASGLRYQISVAQTSRECAAVAGNLNMKIGVQGRVVLGPVGGPGTIQVPIRYALVQEGPVPKTIWTKLHTVPVTVPEGQPNTFFTHVEDALSVPMPGGSDIEAYVVYVGFDALGSKAQPEKKSPARKRGNQG